MEYNATRSGGDLIGLSFGAGAADYLRLLGNSRFLFMAHTDVFSSWHDDPPIDLQEFKRRLVKCLTVVRLSLVYGEPRRNLHMAVTLLAEWFGMLPQENIEDMQVSLLAAAVSYVRNPSAHKVANLFYCELYELDQVSSLLHMTDRSARRLRSVANSSIASAIWWKLHLPVVKVGQVGNVPSMQPVLERRLRREFQLTGREVDLALLFLDFGTMTTEAEIANELWITSLDNVKQHRKNLFKKLQVSSRPEAITKLGGLILDVGS